MITRTTAAVEFDALRPRLLALLELHRTAQSDAERATLVELFEDVFLATAWHVAQDLLENGWAPGLLPSPPSPHQRRLRLVSATDAA
jgi:hypothetical protein